MIRKKFKDKDFLWLIDTIIDSSPGDKGIPIGPYLSQYLANFYLAYFDHYMKEVLKLKYVVRYMDDIVILHSDKSELHRIRVLLNEYLVNNLKLKMKENYQVFPVESRGIDFVGFVFFHEHIKLRKRNKMSLIKTVKKIIRKHKKGREITHSEFCSINARVGFFQYFDHYNLYKKYITPIIKILARYHRNNVAGGKTEAEKDKKTIEYIEKLQSKLYQRKNVQRKVS